MTNNQIDSLKPCPFCGGNQVDICQNPKNEYYIICSDCEMMTNFYNESQKLWLIGIWNTRYIMGTGRVNDGVSKDAFVKHTFRFEKQLETLKKSIKISGPVPNYNWVYITPFDSLK